MSKNIDNVNGGFKQDAWTKGLVNKVQKIKKMGKFAQGRFAKKIGMDPTAFSRILNEKSRSVPEKYRNLIEKTLAKDYGVHLTSPKPKNRQASVSKASQDSRVFRIKKFEDHSKPELIALCKNYEDELSRRDEAKAAKDQDFDDLSNEYQLLHEKYVKLKHELDLYLKGEKNASEGQ